MTPIVTSEPAVPPRQLLPADAYWSPAWFAAEQDRLFARAWNMVGTLDDLGDDRTLIARVAGATVAVDLGPDGCLRARRGGRDGAAVAADSWAGYVFVHLDPDWAPSLAEWLGDFPDRIGGFEPDRLVETGRHRFELASNWKFFVENHIDLYHLWYLHADSLGAYDHPQARWAMCGGDPGGGPHWVFYEPPRGDVDTGARSFWRGLVPIGHVGEERWGSGAHLIFPNLTMATGAGFFMTYQVLPVDPERSIVDLRVRTEAGCDPTDMLELSRTVIEREDGAACAALQAAVRSPSFRVGPLARRHELPITCFHEHLLRAMRP